MLRQKVINPDNRIDRQIFFHPKIHNVLSSAQRSKRLRFFLAILEKRCKIKLIGNQFIYHFFEDGMREVAGEKEARKNELIQAIEEKADHHEYKAGRRSLHVIAPRREYMQS